MRFLSLVLALSCAGGPTSPFAPVTGRVLFIGNSLTSANDLPGVVAAFADSAGAGSFTAQTVTAGGFSLLDHWQAATVRELVRTGRFEVIVLQQGPSSLDESRAELLEYAGRFAGEARAVGTRTALYAVWPEKTRLNVFDRVSESYRLAAEHVDGIYLPAGEAWRAAWGRDASTPLYDLDEFHPSPEGTYLAALVIYARLTQRSPAGLPPRVSTASGRVLDIPPATAALLQEVARETVALYALSANPPP